MESQGQKNRQINSCTAPVTTATNSCIAVQPVMLKDRRIRPRGNTQPHFTDFTSVPLMTASYEYFSFWEQRSHHRSSQAPHSLDEEQGWFSRGEGGGYLQVQGQPGEARHCCQAHILPAIRRQGGPGRDLTSQTLTSTFINKHLVVHLKLKRPNTSVEHMLSAFRQQQNLCSAPRTQQRTTFNLKINTR